MTHILYEGPEANEQLMEIRNEIFMLLLQERKKERKKEERKNEKIKVEEKVT